MRVELTNLPGHIRNMVCKNKLIMTSLYWNGHPKPRVFQFSVISMGGIEMNFGLRKMTMGVLNLH